MRARVIFGCSGSVLDAEEASFFRAVRPWGFILFGRNIVDKSQVQRLVGSLRETVEDSRAPVLIDQEGGRVARLKPPVWAEHPPAGSLGHLYDRNPEEAKEAAYLNARIIAVELSELGINVDCLPVLDLPVPGAHDVIGDRAFASRPAVVIELGRAVIDGVLDGGVLPVMKHIPGHGRAGADSHKELPRVGASRDDLSASDFVPFRGLNQCPMAMSAHVVFEAIDPRRPATTSSRVIRDVIRTEMAYDGLLMSDDISMKALSGPLSGRTKAALFAGCDVVLHCNGDMAEMRQVAGEARPMEGEPLARAERAMGFLRPPAAFDKDRGEARLKELLGTGG